MGDIQNYLDIGSKMLEHPILREKYDIENPKFPGDSPIENALWIICREKDSDNFCDQEKSSTSSITRKLNNLFGIGG